MKIIVLGAGAWGTALAISAAPRHAVTLWARDTAQAAALHTSRVNTRYLPGAVLPANVKVCADAVASLPHMVTQHDLVIIATPLAGLRDTLTHIAQHAHAGQPVAWLCKGFEKNVLLAH